MTAHDLDAAVDRIALKQAGAFSRIQARSTGMTDSMIDQRRALGEYLTLAPGVHALRSHPGSFLRQCWAAVLSEPDAALGAFTAGYFQRLDGIRQGAIELVAPPGSNARNSLARVHRFENVKVIVGPHGLPMTTVAQTVIDIASRCSYPRMDAILDDGLLVGRLTLDDLEERLAAYEGTRRPGLPLMRAMLADRREDGWQPTESELERRLFRILRGLPGDGRVERQQPFPWRDAPPGRVDAWLPGYWLLVEADGRRWHARTKDFDHDRWRDSVALAHGVPVMRFTWAHVTQRPHEVRQLVIAAGARRRVS